MRETKTKRQALARLYARWAMEDHITGRRYPVYRGTTPVRTEYRKDTLAYYWPIFLPHLLAALIVILARLHLI